MTDICEDCGTKPAEYDSPGILCDPCWRYRWYEEGLLEEEDLVPRNVRKAKRAASDAEMDYVTAETDAAMYAKASGGNRKRLARKLKREAKRRNSKAMRRLGRALCDDGDYQ